MNLYCLSGNVLVRLSYQSVIDYNSVDFGHVVMDRWCGAIQLVVVAVYHEETTSLLCVLLLGVMV